MISRLIDWSLRNQLLIALATVLAVFGGLWAARTITLDAIPDLSDVQVIVFTEVPGQAPQVVEDQVTYPLTTALLSVPHAETVRGYSYFGLSFIYVIFDDGTDLYWARSRVLEALNGSSDRLPAGVAPRLGPDATGVGWAFMYVLNSPTRSLAELRSLQDWYLRFGLSGVEGVSEIASLGGFVRQIQVEVDPIRMRAHAVTLDDIRRAIERSNREVGGRVIEVGERELMVRGRGYIEELRDLESAPVGLGASGTPLLLRDVARVTVGPELRRGLADWNGIGETVGGIVVVRADADTRTTIDRVRERLAELEKGLPDDVEISIAYDRSGIIDRAVDTLTRTLVEEAFIVALVCAVFLLHFRSALVAIVSIPAAILLSLIVMRVQGVGANIMSLGGIAISIGVLVDAAVVMVENAHTHLERWGGRRSRLEVIRAAAVEVGPTLFFSLLVITVSFLPIFALEAEEGRLFRPLAFTKTYAVAMASLVAVTLIPVLIYWLVRGRIRSDAANPISRLLKAVYTPGLDLALRRRWLIVLLALVVVASAWIPVQRMGSEFMPPLWEGDLLYMPTTFPGISVTKARELLQQTDRIIASFPEVESVLGKVGRAETATDPAPLSMIESTIVLKDPSEWRPGMTKDKLIHMLDAAVQFPGLTNSWTMPIRTRIDMLSTGIRTPVGIKVAGPDLNVIEQVAKDIEAVVATLPGTLSAYADRVMGGTYLDIEIDRAKAARHGLTVADVQDVIASAIGGRNVTWLVDGLERVPVSVRYPRELRDNLPALAEVLVPAPTGGQLPLGRLATITIADGPPVIKTEDARPNAWVYVDLRDIDVGSWIETARDAVAREVEIPDGVSILWSGQYEAMARSSQRLAVIIPITALLILVILYLNTRSLVATGIVLVALPFSAVGGIWLVDLLGYNWSIAVWVGLIALAGLDAETGAVMLLYLDLAWKRWRGEDRLVDLAALRGAIAEGAVQRIRPKAMTVATTFFALLPILWATGAGADVMRRIAAPMVGGVALSFIAELVIYPVLFYLWKSRSIHHESARFDPDSDTTDTVPGGSSGTGSMSTTDNTGRTA
ncbi:MAG: CusA/CzcA family heavy metal efflux RND transporter [Thermoanaerobaculales bacterium]|jgi:Cu(I)/Ag(I) efflux system membrane protein CusA/SilA|nr:CusA/CzcA family heavy metal efflux RND transporter [Thermoanaerobaculales bacterium]